MQTRSRATPRLTRDRVCRLEARFLRPHRGTVLFALVGLFVASLLPLPVPLLQGRVLDAVVAAVHEGRAEPAAGWLPLEWLVGGALVVSALCYGLRMALCWRVSAVMTRVSLEVV